MIFDCILCAAFNDLCYIGPAIANSLMSLNQLSLLVFTPSLALDIRPQLIVPSFTTLLANAARKMLGNDTPVALAMLANKPVILIMINQQQAEAALEQTTRSVCNYLPSAET